MNVRMRLVVVVIFALLLQPMYMLVAGTATVGAAESEVDPPVSLLATPANLRLNGDKPCGYQTNVNSITPTWDAVDGAVRYNYRVTLPNGETYGPVDVGDTTSVTGPFGGEGLSTFSVQAVGPADLTSDWAEPCAVTYDITVPSVAINPIADSTNTTPIISGVTTEKNGQVKVSLNGSEVATVVSDGDGNWSWTTDPALAVGNYTASAVAVDAAGNTSDPATTSFAVLDPPVDPEEPTDPETPVYPVDPTTPTVNPDDAETPTQSEEDSEDEETPTIAFLPQTISGPSLGAAETGALPTGDNSQSISDVAGATIDSGNGTTAILGTEDTKPSWSFINAVMTGLVVLLGVITLAGIRRGEGNHTLARILTIIPAAAATITFFVVETVSASMIWVNVWTWLFAAVLVAQMILTSIARRQPDN